MLLRCFPRLHIGLMDMGYSTARSYGGAGFTVSSPVTEISATANNETKLHGLAHLDSRAKGDLVAALTRLSALDPSLKASLTIEQLPLQHVGLGTKTSLILGALTASSIACGRALSRQELQRMSGRGGASGIGIHSFFDGGFLTDAGHAPTADLDLTPSSFRLPQAIPPITSRVTIPVKWQFYLLVPSGNRLSGAEEQEFFRNNTPVPRSEVLESIALLYHGVVPAVLTGDLKLLRTSISDLQRFGFKQRELKAQSNEVKKIIGYFDGNMNCAVGLSSMGPLVYVIGDESDQSFASEVLAVCKRFQLELLTSCKGRNEGFEVVK